MDNKCTTEKCLQFDQTMLLVYFIVSIFGFLIFAVLLIFFFTKIDVKKVDSVSKFIIVILFAFNVSQLTSKAVAYSLNNDKELALSIIDLIILYMIVVVQFKFLYEMGEVYIKISSDNPIAFQENFRKIKLLHLIFYIVVLISFTL